MSRYSDSEESSESESGSESGSDSESESASNSSSANSEDEKQPISFDPKILEKYKANPKPGTLFCGRLSSWTTNRDDNNNNH